jgi:hypothetical protein
MGHSASKSRLLLKILLSLVLVMGAGFAVASAIVSGPRALLARDPPRMDYSRLRQGLGEAAKVARGALNGTRRAARLASAVSLEKAILYSRASARRTRTEPIPAEIREQLEDYFPEHILDEIRWAFPNEYFDLGTVVAAWYGSEGGAVTLRDTIVFSTAHGAGNRYLWAHELTHAVQYDELGTADFAKVYVTNPKLLEQQAWANADAIVRDLQQRNIMPGTVGPKQFSTPSERVPQLSHRVP